MKSAIIRLVLVAMPIVASHSVFAANGGFPSTIPIPAHELNFSPAFGGYSGDLTLLRAPAAAKPRGDPLLDARNTTYLELAEAERNLAVANAKLKQLKEERAAALAKKNMLEAELRGLPTLTPIRNSVPSNVEPAKAAAPAPAPKP